MFKKVLIILIILFITEMSFAEGFTFWSLGEQSLVESDSLILRAGYEISNKEIGIQTTFFPAINSEVSEMFGFYGIIHLPDKVELPNPFSLGVLPEIIAADVYVGGQTALDLGKDDKGSYSGLFSGMIINELLVLEYQYNRLGDELAEAIDRSNSYVLYFGTMFKF